MLTAISDLMKYSNLQYFRPGSCMPNSGTLSIAYALCQEWQLGLTVCETVRRLRAGGPHQVGVAAIPVRNPVLV